MSPTRLSRWSPAMPPTRSLRSPSKRVTNQLLIDLDDPRGRDPLRVGGKAAALVRARAAGAAVLPGFVVAGAASRAHMAIGAEALGDRVVARSSTILEAGGEWSGAFTSYLDLAPIDLPKAVTGCWASAFTVAALQR